MAHFLYHIFNVIDTALTLQHNENPNIRVLLPTASQKEIEEHKRDMTRLWTVKEAKKIHKLSAIKNLQEIALLSEVKNEVENLISCLLIAGIL